MDVGAEFSIRTRSVCFRPTSHTTWTGTVTHSGSYRTCHPAFRNRMRSK